MEYYQTSLQHLLAELERISFLIKSYILQLQQTEPTENVHPGLQLTEREVMSLLDQPLGMPAWATLSSDNTTDGVRQAAIALQETILQKTAESLKQSINLRLPALMELYHLTADERDVLLFCLISELDLRYQKLYSYLQNDITRKNPSVDLMLNLLSDHGADKISKRSFFNSQAALIKHKLIYLTADNNSAAHPALLSQSVQLNKRIVAYLLEENVIAEEIARHITIVTPAITFDHLLLPAKFKQQLTLLAEKVAVAAIPSIIYLHGKPGAGKQSVAEAICQKAGIPLLIADLKTLLEEKPVDFNENICLIQQEALLRGAAIHWKNFHALLEAEKSSLLEIFIRQIKQYSGLLFLAGHTDWHQPINWPDKWFIQLKLPELTGAERRRLWQQQAGESVGVGLDLNEVADRFQFTPGKILAAANRLQQVRHWHQLNNEPFTKTDLHQLCCSQTSHQLNTMARRITPTYTRGDIILPADCQAQLDEILNYLKYYTLVYEQWGFAKKLAMGKGLNTLFTGQPGTGKTMAAEIIAVELGLDLYKINLSGVISKYIGETEKNLDRIFTEAETTNVILFFDEADALFGKRSEVNNSHDRYANIETSYLLQKMEAYQGIVILASNFKRNMDEAFVRRLHFSIEFPFPAKEERLRIWQSIWPANLRLAEDVSLEKLAEHLEIAGGNIRNVALTAAFKAAEEQSDKVTMAHLTHAAQRELKKIGKVVRDGEMARTFA